MIASAAYVMVLPVSLLMRYGSPGFAEILPHLAQLAAMKSTDKDIRLSAVRQSYLVLKKES